jgi:peptidoglycan/LPS O-acetylase OafA/YrhL
MVSLLHDPRLNGFPMYFPVIAHSIAAGCALALLMPRVKQSKRAMQFLSSSVGAMAILGVAIGELGRYHPRLNTVAAPLLDVSLCYLVARYTEFPGLAWGRVLNWTALVWIGRLSYSLYLWQQLFLVRGGTALVQSFPLNFILPFGVALLSYVLIEQPLERVRARLKPGKQDVKSAPSIQPAASA